MLDDVEDRLRKKKAASVIDLREELDDVKDSFIRSVKTRIFMLFYDINSSKLNIDKNYHILLIVIETV
jgi:hypothetical protein